MFESVTQFSATRLTLLAIIFAVVVILTFVLLNFFGSRSAVRKELHDIAKPTKSAVPQKSGSLRSQANDSAWARLADSIERAGLNLGDTKSDRLREKMIAAGYASPAAPRIFTLVRLILIFLLPLGYILLAYSGAEPPSFLKVYIISAVLALIGLYGPNLFVQAKVDRRKEKIVNGFPDCLDLMLVCVEAGLGVEAAMDRVGREMSNSHPLVAGLLSMAVLNLRAGASREEAFRKLADAARVDEIRSFTTLLIQSDKLGTSLSATLRVYSAEMREKRRMRAEEKAHRIPVLISIPLVACMLPTMIGVLMLPAAIQVARVLFPIMAR